MRVENKYTFKSSISDANSRLFVWMIFLFIGMITGNLWLSMQLVALFYSLHVISAWTIQKRIKLLYYFAAFFFIIIFRDHLVMPVFIGILYAIDIVFNLGIKFVVRRMYRSMPIGLELVVFNTVLVGSAFGPTAGMVTGLLFGSTYYGILFNFRSAYQFICIPAYGLVGYLAGVLPIENITVLGMLLATGYALVTSALITVIYGGKVSKSVIFIVTNLIFNFILFTNISKWVLFFIQ